MQYCYAFEMAEERHFLSLADLLPGRSVYLKLEGVNPAGSIKLKAALAMVREAERAGLLTPGGCIIESSSGSLGISLAMIAAARGYRFTCVVDPNLTPSAARAMAAFGARLHAVDEADSAGGYLANRLRAVRDLIAREPDLVWLDQYTNQANPLAHSRGTAAAILAEFATVDYLFVGVGTAGTLAGCADCFAHHSPHTQLVAVDSEGSITFGGAPAPRRIPGLGASVPPPLFDDRLAHRQLNISERDAIVSCRMLARRYGYLAGGSTGAIVGAILATDADIPDGSVVVALAPDAGDRYLDTVYDDGWVELRYGREVVEAAQAWSRRDARRVATEATSA